MTEAGKTSTGKQKLKIGGHWYYLGRALKGASPAVGTAIDLKYSLFGDKGDLRSLEAWRPSQDAKAAQAATPVPAGIDEASLRFISNVVGSAIMSGACKDPVAVSIWFNAAKGALECKPVDRSEMYQPVPGVDDAPQYGDLESDQDYPF